MWVVEVSGRVVEMVSEEEVSLTGSLFLAAVELQELSVPHFAAEAALILLGKLLVELEELEQVPFSDL